MHCLLSENGAKLVFVACIRFSHMAALFSSKQKYGRTETVCNGGLGGLVEMSQLQIPSFQDRSKGSPRGKRRSKQRPPPIVIPSINGSISFTTYASTTIAIHNSDTPTTSCPPIIQTLPHCTSYELEGHSPRLYKPRLQTPKTTHPWPTLPWTPLTPTKRPNSSPVELPDTPAQIQNLTKHLPPTPPSPPAGETPAQPLSPLISIYNPLAYDNPSTPKMERFKNLSTPEKRTATSRDASGKSLDDMSLDELLRVLPSLPPQTIRTAWVPAMEEQFQQVKRSMAQGANSQSTMTDASLGLVFEVSQPKIRFESRLTLISISRTWTSHRGISL